MNAVEIDAAIVQQTVGRLPWGHDLVLLRIGGAN